MKTFKDYCNEVAKEKGLPYPWESSVDHDPMGDFWWGFEVFEEANKRYTTASIKEHLIRAAENATKFRDLEDENTRDLYESITNIDITLP